VGAVHSKELIINLHETWPLRQARVNKQGILRSDLEIVLLLPDKLEQVSDLVSLVSGLPYGWGGEDNVRTKKGKAIEWEKQNPSRNMYRVFYFMENLAPSLLVSHRDGTEQLTNMYFNLKLRPWVDIRSPFYGSDRKFRILRDGSKAIDCSFRNTGV
jgi:hypothetical protein